MNVTVCNVNHNQVHAVSLMRESLLHYHPHLSFTFNGWDNASTDGATDYMRQHYDYLFEAQTNWHYDFLYSPDGPWPHNLWAPDRLCLRSETPYTLLLDSDVEFTGDVLTRALEQMQEYSCVTVAPRQGMGTAMVNGTAFAGQERIDPAFALWCTADLQHLLQYTTWGRHYCIDTLEWFDGGAMLYRFAQAARMPVLRADWVWENFTHFGEITALWTVGPEVTDPAWLEKRAILEQRYQTVADHLEALRQMTAG